MVDGTSRRGEVLWLVGLHVEVRCCDLDEQMIFGEKTVELVEEGCASSC